MTKDKYELRIRDAVVKKMKNKYNNWPTYFREEELQMSTSSSLVIDEIAWSVIQSIKRKMKKGGKRNAIKTKKTK